MCLRKRGTHTYTHKHRHTLVLVTGAIHAIRHTRTHKYIHTYLRGQILSKGPRSTIKIRAAPYLLGPLLDTDGIGSKTQGGFNAGKVSVCVYVYECMYVYVFICV